MHRLRRTLQSKHGVVAQMHSTPQGVELSVRRGLDILWSKFIPYGMRHMERRRSAEVTMMQEVADAVQAIEQDRADTAIV